MLAALVPEPRIPAPLHRQGKPLDVAPPLDWRNPVRFADSIGYQLLREYGGSVMEWDELGVLGHRDRAGRTLDGDRWRR